MAVYCFFLFIWIGPQSRNIQAIFYLTLPIFCLHSSTIRGSGVIWKNAHIVPSLFLSNFHIHVQFFSVVILFKSSVGRDNCPQTSGCCQDKCSQMSNISRIHCSDASKEFNVLNLKVLSKNNGN